MPKKDFTENRALYAATLLLFLLAAPALAVNATIVQAPSAYANDTSYNATVFQHALSFGNNTGYNVTVKHAITSFSNTTERAPALQLQLDFFDMQQQNTNQTLSVIVRDDLNNLVDNATVNGTVIAPNGTQTRINFTETALGNYTKNFTFDAIGNWTIAVSANKTGFANVSSSKGIYVGLIEFVSLVGAASVQQGDAASFDFKIRNKGNVSSLVFSVLVIYDSSGGVVFSTTGSTVNLSGGVNATQTLTWSVGSAAAGTYNATGYLNFTDTLGSTVLTPNRTLAFNVTAAPAAPAPPAAGGGAGGGGVIIVKNVTEAVEVVPAAEFVQFEVIPILIEAYPGYRTAQPITMYNPTDAAIENIKVGINNIPFEWFSIDRQEIDLQPGERATITIYFDLPPDVKPGNYQGVFSFANSNYLRDFPFILRINQILPGQTSLVSKESTVDEVGQRTRFVIFVKNRDKPLESLTITERIDKSIASNVNELEFSVQPTKVLQADPIVQWTLSNLLPNEQRNITYRVRKVINTTRPFIQTSIEEIVSIEKISAAVALPIVNIYDIAVIVPIAILFIIVLVYRMRKARSRESLNEARKLAERLRGRT